VCLQTTTLISFCTATAARLLQRSGHRPLARAHRNRCYAAKPSSCDDVRAALVCSCKRLLPLINCSCQAAGHRRLKSQQAWDFPNRSMPTRSGSSTHPAARPKLTAAIPLPQGPRGTHSMAGHKASACWLFPPLVLCPRLLLPRGVSTCPTSLSGCLFRQDTDTPRARQPMPRTQHLSGNSNTATTGRHLSTTNSYNCQHRQRPGRPVLQQ